MKAGEPRTTSYRLSLLTYHKYTLLASLIQDLCHAHDTHASMYMLLHLSLQSADLAI